MHVLVRRPGCKAFGGGPGELCSGSRASPSINSSELWKYRIRVLEPEGGLESISGLGRIFKLSPCKSVCVYGCIPGKQVWRLHWSPEELESQIDGSLQVQLFAVTQMRHWSNWPTCPRPLGTPQACVNLWCCIQAWHCLVRAEPDLGRVKNNQERGGPSSSKSPPLFYDV